MAEELKPEAEQQAVDYPTAHFPVLFADIALNAVWGRGVVKWYFARSNPPTGLPGPTRDVAVAQIVMPAEGFVAMSLFFDQVREALVRDGLVGQDLVDRVASAGTSGLK